MMHAQVLTALADPTRRRVFEALRSGPKPVSAIAARLPVSRPAVSQHLKALREARLVVARAEGRQRLYSIDARGVDALRNWLDGFWDETLSAFKIAAEREAIRERKSR
jgi:DNA-binding transcriptional ArsR family regulator